MMSKAAFMMQDHVRRHYVMITDVCNPNTFFVRGRLPFPQGLMAIAVLFKNQRPADVYAHPYFIEKQSDPSQPSPQLHLTEESQGIMKVMGGLRYMRDDNTKLDNTMVVVTDYKVEVEGRMPRVPPAASTAPAGPQVTPAHDGKKRSASGLTLEQRAMVRRTIHHVAQTPGGGGNAGLGLGGMRSPFLAASRPAAVPSTASSSSSRSSQADASEAARGAGDSNPSAAWSSDAASTSMPGYSTFPTPEECATDAWASYHYLRAAIFGRGALEDASGHASPMHPIDVPALFERRVGGYTVLYNPIEVNERTFVELLLKLQQEERVVKAIVVPTRPAWRHLQVWADIFPDAELVTSGEVPLLPAAAAAAAAWPSSSCGGTKESADRAGDPQHCAAKRDSSGAVSGLRATPSMAAAPATEWRGGCQDMGSGMTGLSFPEVDLAAEATLERQRADEAAAKARLTTETAQRSSAPRKNSRAVDEDEEEEEEEEEEDMGNKTAGTTTSGGTAVEREQRAMWRRQQQKRKLRQEMRAEDARAAASQHAPSHDSGDLVDVLWRDASFFTEKRVQAVGLRESDAWRLRVLSPRAASCAAPPVDVVLLTPTIELRRISGDSTVEEYVLLDANSNSLACTDLYHGEYADLDPANSWMCRVWFKFMKRGDYKRTDLVPRYKWLQVLQQRSLSVVQSAIDDLTRRRPIKCVLSAHGTPPLSGVEAVNTLRRQWNLPPLHPSERPPEKEGKEGRGRAREDS